MVSRKLIYSGRWSKGYRKGDIFIKELNHYEPIAMYREVSANIAAANAGINTPLCCSYADDGCTLSIHYPFVEMNKIEKFTENVVSNILHQLMLFKHINWNQNDEYWELNLLTDFRDALHYVTDESDKIYTILNSLTKEVFIHGDFSKDNISICNNGIVIYDFQHGCLGPKGWDLVYLAGSLHPTQCTHFGLSDFQRRLALCVAMIKHGRAIRKNSDEICSTYKKMIAWQKETFLI
jgi:tRNA A-37 threonylcarbamoyl transferase component Bud32